jgi:hypothetical protein
MKKPHQNFAVLKPDSPFFPIFRDGGRVPIKNLLQPLRVKLDGSDETEAYLLDWSACTIAQRLDLAAAIAKSFRNTPQRTTPEEFRSFMDRGGDLPIRVSSTVSADLSVETRLLL